MGTKSVIGSLSLSQIIERQINFLLNNEIFPKQGNEDADRGEFHALERMLEDSKILSEIEFVSKYLSELASLKKRFESKAYSAEDGDDYYESYNNTLVFILKFIDPIYEYDLGE